MHPGAAARDAPHVLHADDSHVIGTWRRHVVVIWRREISVPGVALWSRSMGDLLKAHPGQRINTFVYVEETCAFSGSPVTFAACVDALKRFESGVAATAVVYAREGFWNAAMRGRVTAIHSESKAETPYVLQPSLSAAIEWLSTKGDDELKAQALALAPIVEALRQA